MKHLIIYIQLLLFLQGLVGYAWATVCTDGTGDPPFLGISGENANVLLLIDNSASMYDLAYIGATDQNACYDDSYVSTELYAGCFDSTTDYYYNFNDNKFVTTDPGSTTCDVNGDSTTGTETTYTSTGVEVKQCKETITIDAESVDIFSITSFKTSGNYLNWLAASKLDIEKTTLTGGKYDSTNSRIIPESRGCLGRRYIKQIEVASGGTTYYLTVGVRQPTFEDYFSEWQDATGYNQGDIIRYGDNLYSADAAGTSSGDNYFEDTGVDWSPYDNSWVTGRVYTAGWVVEDKGQYYVTTTGGTSNGTSVTDDTGVTDWHSLTNLEIYEISTDFFDIDACQDAVDEMTSENPNQGQLKSAIDLCMGYDGANNTPEGNSNAAFNLGIHTCWTKAKTGDWPSGGGWIESTINACEKIYEDGLDPWEIIPDMQGYLCAGGNTSTSSPYGSGYVGKCWDLGTPASGNCLPPNINVCYQWENDGTCKKYEPKLTDVCDPQEAVACAADGYTLQYICNGELASNNGCDDSDDEEEQWIKTCAAAAGTAGWITDPDDCVEEGMIAFCTSQISIPNVIDPTDQASDTNTNWNMPAMLADFGVLSQKGDPIAVLKSYVAQATQPLGVIQEFAQELYIGVMIFNDDGCYMDGTDAEIDVDFTEITNFCNDRDGGRIIADIDQGDAHTATIVNAINSIKATSWTPLAEAYYNAIGYYTQNTSIRLDAGDWSLVALEADDTSGHPFIQGDCQTNNILIITEGASTADKNSVVATAGLAIIDDDTAAADALAADDYCGSLAGTTYLDDLAYFAMETDPAILYGAGKDFKNINTHVVVAGTPRSDASVTGECDPLTLLNNTAFNGGTTEALVAPTITVLGKAIAKKLTEITEGASAGSAASVVSASRSGEGALYQAIFWQKAGSSEAPVYWIGDVHALHMDSYGKLYEDTVLDGKLDTDNDERVVFYFDGTANRTKVCVGSELDSNGECTGGTSKFLSQLSYLWSAADWMADITDANIVIDRGTFISNTAQRKIFTWMDDGDGEVESAEVIDLIEKGAGGNWTADEIAMFGESTSDEVDQLINWIRGLDQDGMRSREIPEGAGDKTWRLGDVIHSTPVDVSRPSEGLHLIYEDESYIDFLFQYQNRRHVVYFGANDGMFHAVNGGFFNAADNKFCKSSDCQNEAGAPDLGAELWAYVPYNLLPHLKCLTDTSYGDPDNIPTTHKYFVDLRPRIFDVQIFDPTDADHPNGWGTILVCGMRFGGAETTIGGQTYSSAYFVFDITNPEVEPELLGEITVTGTSVDLNYTTIIPTVVPMKTGDNTNGTNTEWYLILGTGPTALDGTSNQPAKICSFNLRRLTGQGAAAGPFRIPDAVPDATGCGCYQLYESDGTTPVTGFVSDPVTVDYDLDSNYMADVVYFGTIEGNSGDSGKLYRMVTRSVSGGNQVETEPGDWSTSILYDASSPITAPAGVGTDGYNYWVYFGTGRFFTTSDKTNYNANTFYGIREPRGCSGGNYTEFTWATINSDMVDVTDILVAQETSPELATLSCDGGGNACLPPADGGSSVDDLAELADYIGGIGCDNNTMTGKNGWYRDLPARERVLGQATLLGGLLTFSSFDPNPPGGGVGPCEINLGAGLAYGVYFQTGTAWHEIVFGNQDDPTDTNVLDRIELGTGMVASPSLQVGRSEGSKAFIQTSTGTIVEVSQINLPVRTSKSGSVSWKEIDDAGDCP